LITNKQISSLYTITLKYLTDRVRDTRAGYGMLTVCEHLHQETVT